MSNTDTTTKTNLSITSPSEEEMRAAVYYALIEAETDMRNFPENSGDQMRANALRAVLQRLEASRWRPAIADVVAERQRQIGGEGWDHDHDDRHTSGELLFAATAYCENVGQAQLLGFGDDTPKVQRVPQYWPWSLQWWKPKNRRRDLVRAAALLIAEIERLDRASPPSITSEDTKDAEHT